MNTSSASCPICHGQMERRTADWLRYCRGCRFWDSSLWDTARWESKQSDLDEPLRIKGIELLRRENFHRIFNMLKRFKNLHGASICDIGCGYGWFLEVAQQYGLKPLGIEPEESIAQQAAQYGEIRCGLFPACLKENEQFDFIIFNDVFEHLQDIEGAATACRKHLKHDGLLVINIPSSRGVFFQIARLLYSFGLTRPFERMWQRNFHSPHLSYFNDDNLRQFLEARGFQQVHHESLNSITTKGLWSRVQMDRSQSRVAGAVTAAGLLITLPLLLCFPSDITVHCYRPK